MTAFKMRSKEIIVAILWMISLAQTVEHSVQKRQIGSPGQRVVCYFANWAVYRQGTAKFTPQNINPYLCTHLIYAFGGLTKDDTIQPFDKYQDIEKGGYSQLAALKTYNKELKTLLAIGGWNEGSKRFSPMVADPARRRSFIKSAIRFARQYNFDGIDLDWEYPSFRDGGKPEDRVNYAKLIIEMREAFDLESEQTGKERLLITMAVPASLEYAGKGFDIKTLNKHLDFFNFLTYDYHSSYEPSVNHHSPLFRPKDVSEYDFRADLNVDATVKFYIKSGASRDKLVLGIPTYGRSYTLVNPDAHQIGSPTDGPGEQGKGTKEDGYLAYYEICEGIKQDNWTVERPNPGLVGPYAHHDNFWVGYDDINAVMDKAIYVSEEGLGGIMFWTIDNDDFRGACHDKPFPLIESAKEALFGKVNSQVKTSVSVSTSEQTRVERVKLTPKQLENLATEKDDEEDFRTPLTPRPRSLPSGVTIDPFNTPSPPTTPSNEPSFECKSEGFFPHKSICKKYYWCLEAAGLGMVAHTFTCPGGLYFNVLTDGCDFKRNVDCGGKDTEDAPPSSTTTATPQSAEDDSEEDPQSLKDILSSIKAAGGLEAFENQLKEAEEHKEELIEQENTRKTDISSQTRNRLNQLLERKRAESNSKLEGGQENEDEQTQASRPDTNPDPSPDSGSEPEQSQPSVASSTEPEPTTSVRTSLLGRLANRRLNSGGSDRLRRLRQRFQAKEKAESTDAGEVQEEPQVDSASPAAQSDTTTARSRLFGGRPRFGANRDRSALRANPVTTTPKARTVLRGRDRFRNLLSRPSLTSVTTTPTPTSSEASSSNEDEIPLEDPSEDDANTSTLRPNRFRPKSGTRDRLRAIVRESLEEIIEGEENTNDNEEEPQFVASDKQRVPPVFKDEPEASLRPKSRFEPEYVEINRGPVPKPQESEEAITSSQSSTVAPLEYVTLSRGSPSDPSNVDTIGNKPSEIDEETLGSPRTGLESQFITPLPFDAAIREDDEEGADEIPLGAVTPEPARNLEYVTLRRGQEAAANTVPDSSDEVISNQVGDSQIRLGPSRINLRARPRYIRSAEVDAPVSIIFPTLNSRTLNDANVIPDLPVQKDVSYIFPFSPGFKRDHRQTSPIVDPSTAPNTESPETITTIPTTTVETTSEETIPIADVDVVSGDEDFNEEDYEVSVSVSKSVSETFSVINPPEGEIESSEDMGNTEAPTDSHVPEQPEASTDFSIIDEDEIPIKLSITTVTTPLVDTESSSATSTSTEASTSRFQSLLRNRKKPALAPKLHSILSPHSHTDLKTPKALNSKDRQHPFFKQRSSLFGAPTIEASTTTETPVEEGEKQIEEDETEELEGSGTEPTTEADSVEIETTTKGSFFAQKMQERLLKAAEEKKPVVSNGNKFSILGNRKTRPKFVLPSSLKQRIQQESKEDEENSIEKVDLENEINDEDNNNLIDDDENSKPDVDVSVTSTTEPSSRFKQKSLFRPRPAGLSRPISKFAPRAKPTISTSPSPISTSATESKQIEESTEGFKKTTLGLRPRIRPVRPLDLSPSPSRTVSKVSRGESTTFAPTTTTQLTVADLLAELQGENDQPATLRPNSFKPKFGSRQREKLREKLKEQLASDGHEFEPKEISFDNEDAGKQEEADTSAEEFTPPLTGNRRTISRPRSRFSSRPVAERPRSSTGSTNPISRPSNALRSRSRPRVSQPLPTVKQEPFVTTSAPFETEPLTVTEYEETTTEPPVSGRQLSDSDIMSGLGLTPEVFNDVEDTEEIPELEEYPEDMEDPIEEPLIPVKSNDPNDFLLQLVHDNQKHAQESAQSTDDGETGSFDTPIMQNPSLLVTPSDVQTEKTTIQDVPLVFNPEQLLRSAIVESKLPPEITAKPRRKNRPHHQQQQQQLQQHLQELQQQEQEEQQEYDDFNFENDFNPEPLEEQIAFRPRPAPRPAPRPVPRRLPARAQNRFVPPNAETSTPDDTSEASFSELPQRVVSNRRQRIRNRGRTPIRQSDNEIDVSPTIKDNHVEEKIPVAVPRRSSPSRGRVPVRTRARLIRPNQDTPTESQPEDTQEVNEPQENSTKDKLVIRRGNSRPITRGRSRLRVVSRSQIPISDEVEEDNNEAVQEEVQNSELPSEAVNEAERSAPSRSRIRIRGKLVSAQPQLELTTPTNLQEDHEDETHDSQVFTEATTTTTTPTTASTTTPTSTTTTTKVVPNEEPPITTHRPISLLPLFGAKTVIQEKRDSTTEGQVPTTSSIPVESSTKEKSNAASLFKSVSPHSGLKRIPAAFFTTPSPRFSSFPPRDFDDDVEAELSTRRSFPRVERSTLGPVIVVTTPDYLRQGVSGHSFQDISILTTTQPSTLEDEDETKEQTTEEATPRPKSKLIKKSKIKIKKSLFGRKRPNFLKALEKTIIEEKDKDRKALNGLFGRTTDDSANNGTEEKESVTITENEPETAQNAGETSIEIQLPVEETASDGVSSTTESSPIELLKSINVTPKSSYDADSFRRPRRRLDLNGLKSLYSRKNSLTSERLSPSSTENISPSALSTTESYSSDPFIPTQTTSESNHLTGLNNSASSLVQGKTFASTTEPSLVQGSSTSETDSILENVTEADVPVTTTKTSEVFDRKSFLKARLKNKLRYGRKSFASAASTRKFAPSPLAPASSNSTQQPPRASSPPFLKRKLKKSPSSTTPSIATTTTTASTVPSSLLSNPNSTIIETSSTPIASIETTTPIPHPYSSKSQDVITTLATEAPVVPVNDNPTVAPESFSNVDKDSSPNNRRTPLRSRPFPPRASVPRFSFPTRNTTPNPPRRSSLLILSNPSPTPSFEDSFTLSIASSTPAPSLREEPRNIEISEPSFPSSVAPPRNLGPRPEEQLFQQVSQQQQQQQQQQFEDVNDELAFASRFEEPQSSVFTIVDGTRDRPEGPIVATAVPLISRPTVRPQVKPLARSPSPIRRRRPSVQTTPQPQAEYEYYYEYYYDEDEDGVNDIPESRSKPVPSIDDYDLQPLTNKVEILPSGRTLCHDVGVFPHPHSCRKFVMCSRRTTRDGITGWEYECPIYLAFDPVGGRCNWATDVVCS